MDAGKEVPNPYYDEWLSDVYGALRQCFNTLKLPLNTTTKMFYTIKIVIIKKVNLKVTIVFGLLETVFYLKDTIQKV